MQGSTAANNLSVFAQWQETSEKAHPSDEMNWLKQLAYRCLSQAACREENWGRKKLTTHDGMPYEAVGVGEVEDVGTIAA